MQSTSPVKVPRRKFLLGFSAAAATFVMTEALGSLDLFEDLDDSDYEPAPPSSGRGTMPDTEPDTVTASMGGDSSQHTAIIQRIKEATERVLRQARVRSSGDLLDNTGDAALAWRYFQQWKMKYDGMCPGTAYPAYGRIEGYRVVTMWDVASYANGHCAAFVLGLISHQQLVEAAVTLVIDLQRATFAFRKRKLPHVDLIAGGNGDKSEGFDSADAGRLLIALRIMDNFTLGKAGIAELVGSWDFNVVMKDGRLYNVVKGRLRRFSRNSYTHYSTHGYKLWGYEVESIYDASPAAFGLAEQADFFVGLANRGRVATEPNTTELIEVGTSASVEFICDMLLAAQMERHAETGKLTCVSEGLLDQTPWFSYQACQFAMSGPDQWVIDTSSRTNSAIVAKKGMALRTVSTKGCYLWDAVRPGNYSRRLRQFAQSRGNLGPIGFASNIYESTLKPTTCADVNTNGIILESLAYVKAGNTPLLAQSEWYKAISVVL